MAKAKVERIDEIRKAIKLLGWVAVIQRIRTPEDRKLFDQLSDEVKAEREAGEDRILKRHKIKF